MTDYQYEACKDIIEALAYKYGQSRIPAQKEDLVLVGWECAVKAIADWKEGVGSWSAYVVQKVRWGIIDYLRTHWHSRSGAGSQLVDQVIFGEEEGMLLPPTNFSDPAEHIDIEILLNRLSRKNRDIIESIYFLDEKGTNIAKHLGVSSSRITQSKNESIAIMANYAKKENSL
jgi:RNA polymerase sigma factor (sigma-70 family)